MSLKRLALITAISHSTHHNNHTKVTNNTPVNVFGANNNFVNNTSNNGNFNSNNNLTDSSFFTNTNYNNKNFTPGLRSMRAGSTNMHGNGNVLLGGAMLSAVTTIVCLVCYCCHRKIKKRTNSTTLYQQQRWLESDPNMEIYSVEQYFDTSGGATTYMEQDAFVHEPPPSYDCVVALDDCSRKPKSPSLFTFKGSHDECTEKQIMYNDEPMCYHNCSTQLCANCSSLIGEANYYPRVIRSSRNYEYLSDGMNLSEAIEVHEENVGTSTSTSDPNNNVHIVQDGITEEATEIDENGNIVVQQVADFNSISDNGLIRLDMSQIIDQTGLPTYEAAIKLDTSGYV